MRNFNRDTNHVTWRETDRSWLKAKGRAVRAMFDSTGSQDGIGRYVVAGIATIAIASTVGLSGVIAGPVSSGKVLTSSLNPLTGAIGQFFGAPVSAQELEECGPVAADVSTNSSASAGTDATVEPDPGFVIDNLPPLGPGDIPLDIPTVPPVGGPTDPEPPTSEPEPPTGNPEPPAGDPEPPVDESGGDLIGADVNLGGEDLLDLGILDGGLLGVSTDSLDPDGTGTSSSIGVNLNGEEIATIGADPQEAGIVDTTVNGEDPSSGLEGDGTIAGIVEDLVGDEPIADAIGDEPIADLLGDDPLGGLLN